MLQCTLNMNGLHQMVEMSLQLVDLFNLIPFLKLLYFAIKMFYTTIRMNLRDMFVFVCLFALFGHYGDVSAVKSNKT